MPQNENAQERPVAPATGHYRFELIFVATLVWGTLLVSLGFTILTVVAGYGFPSTFVAVLLGIGIAAAVHKFLGGVAGAEFAVGAAKLAGSAALIAIVIYLIDGPLQKNMNDVRVIAAGRDAEAKLQREMSETIKERTTRKQLELKVAELESGVKITQSGTVAATLASVRASTADDDLGRGVLGIYRNREGPFRRQAVRFKVRFVHAVPKGTFWFCHDRRPDLHGKNVRFEVVNREAGTSEKITLHAGSDIGLGVCQDIQFDVQLGCDAASELLKLQCNAQRGVAWPEGSTARIFEVVATNMNPEFDGAPQAPQRDAEN